MKTSRNRFFIAVCSCVLASVAWSAVPSAVAGEPDRPANELLVLAGGADLRQSDKASYGALQVRFATDFVGLHPYASVGWASGGSFYGGAGLCYRFSLPHRLRLTVGSGPGYYRHEGTTTNLGYSLEFNSWVELSRVVRGRRMGLSFGHISNAHLGEVNPGTETVGLSVSALSW